VPSTLVADKTTYAPGETAVLHLFGLQTAETVALQVVRTDGATGTTQAGPTWLATDGGVGDFDGAADGQMTVYYTLPADVTLDSFQITATGNSSGSTAQTTIWGDSHLLDVLDTDPAPPATTITVSSSALPAVAGQAVTFTATVASTSTVNSGTVQFLADGFNVGAPVPVVNGQASSDISSLTAGSHTITATYADDTGSFDSSIGSLTQLVNGAPNPGAVPWVDVQPHDVAPGQFANILAGGFQVGETVDFQIKNLTNGNLYAPFSVTDGGASDLDGVANGNIQTVWQVPADALASQLQITATGEASGLTAQNWFTDAAINTSTFLRAYGSKYGSSATFIATVTANSPSGRANTGSVTFLDGTTRLGTANVNSSGIATLATTVLTAGSHTITANYSDGVTFNSSSSKSLTLNVDPYPLWVTANSTSKPEGSTLTFAGTEFTFAGAAGVRRPILFNGDTLTSVTLNSAGAAAAAEDGSYSIVPSAAAGTGLSNYKITYVPGTLTVLEPAILVTSTPVSAINEGDASATVEVATFTHANGVESAGHFSAAVDWGVAGHHADSGTITQDGNGTYHVSAPRPVFTKEGGYSLSVTVSDNDSGANIAQSFDGLSANDNYALFPLSAFPPDQGSAVGPNYYVEMVNSIYAIYHKDGSVAVPNTSLGTFYTNAGVSIPVNSAGMPQLTDPRIVYDPASGRWFAVIVTSESNSNSILVAVSQTSDPTGAWKAAKFRGNNTANLFADYPTIAIDQNALYIATNNYPNDTSFFGVTLTTIPKADLLNPAGPVVANRTHFEKQVIFGMPGKFPVTLAPVSDFDSRDHGVILATDLYIGQTVLHRYNVLNPATSSSTLTVDKPITVPQYWNNQNGHQPDGTQTLDGVDFRIGQNNVYQVGNVIWAADSILTSLSYGSGGYDAIRWYEIDETTNTVLQSGTISDPHHDYIDPAIAANAAGDVVIGFSATGDSTTSDYPGAWYVAGTTTAGVTTFGTPTPLRNGSSNYSIGGGGRNRWGDFSAISVDPNNPNAFWIADEYVAPGNPAYTTRTQLWGTEISEIAFGNNGTATAALTVNEPPINGASATLATVVTGQASATVEVATFTHASGVEPAGAFTAMVDWGITGHHSDSATVTQDVGGTYHVSATRPVFSPGTDTVNVSISEDNASTTVADSQVVNKADTSAAVVSSVNPSVSGQSLTFTATVSITSPGTNAFGNPMGTVTFYDNGVPIGMGTLSGANTDTASFATSMLASTTAHSITAAYTSGDMNFNPSAPSPPIIQTVAGVAVSNSVQQYSDLETYTATISSTLINGLAPATSVSFYVSYGNGSWQYIGTVYNDGSNTTFTPVPAATSTPTSSWSTSGGVITATLGNVPLLADTAGALAGNGSAEMAPGAHTVKAVFSGNANFTVVPTTALTINAEDARSTYAGALFVSTSSSTSSTATVTLAATIQDITAVTGDPAYDAYAGDIRNAQVTFIDRDTNTTIVSGLPVGLVNAGDTKTGTATYNWSVNIGNNASYQYTVGIIVTNYYTDNQSAEDVVVTVSQPLNQSITGGGYLVLSNSAGLKVGDTGSKNNFGFNVKYNNSLTNLHGNINIIIRRTESDNIQHVYQVKGNSMTSLSTQGNGTSSSPGLATFNGKANVQDITDPLNVISIDGNATLQVNMTDNGDPAPDTIGITVWDKSGGMWFSSNWSGTKTVQQAMADPTGGGNLVIHSNQLLQGAPNTGPERGENLDRHMVQSLLPEALAVWQSAGVDVTPVQNLNIQVATLWDGSLAWSMNQAITFDRTAQGYGWFTDAMHAPKPGTLDLLTVLTHELGLQLGFKESTDPHDVMDEYLAPGVRRLSVADEVAHGPTTSFLTLATTKSGDVANGSVRAALTTPFVGELPASLLSAGSQQPLTSGLVAIRGESSIKKSKVAKAVDLLFGTGDLDWST
jgi:hypothetical protein